MNLLYKVIMPLCRTHKGIFLGIFTMLLSACCEKPLISQYGNEAISYYSCSSCGLPYDRIICMTLPEAEEGIKDE